MTVYYVEDDENIRQLVLYALTQSGIQAEGQPDDTAFRAACAKSIPDVVVLDIMLPDVDGLEILKRIRSTPGKLSRVPVMMVTAKNSELDIVRALDTGADEYITKPFGMMEMVSRVRAMLRRRDSFSPELVKFAGMELDCSSHKLEYQGTQVLLGGKEFQIMEMLMARPGAIAPIDRILDQVWNWEKDVDTSVVWVQVSNLRKKIAKIGAPVVLRFERGAGYVLEQTDASGL